MPSNLQFLNKRTMCSLVLTFLLFGVSNTVSAQDVSVLDAQKFLIQNGYSPGVADGILGRRTRGALRDFQRDQYIPQSGELDITTSAAIRGEIISGSETGAAEVESATDYSERSAGPEPPVLPRRSDGADKAAVNFPSEISHPTTFDAPLSILPQAPAPADGFSPSEGNGETGRARILSEDTPPVLVREALLGDARDHCEEGEWAVEVEVGQIGKGSELRTSCDVQPDSSHLRAGELPTFRQYGRKD
ncbi:MAG: peptidoglycan-binding protein [Alphaproteobacteria bacterium]|nr:peptidoglycan-binding protein [Alphaproteobacteria bacterium]